MIHDPYTDPQPGDTLTLNDGGRVEVIGRTMDVVVFWLLDDSGKRTGIPFTTPLAKWHTMFDTDPTDE